MEIHRIQYFLEVARQKNFSRAAERCNVSQPSLSQQIKKLEDELGECLFLRSRDGITLTDFGQQFLPHADAILREVSAAREFSEDYQGKIAGLIKLGAIPTIAPYLLPGIIAYTRRTHPLIQFEIFEETTQRLVELLREGTLDFALLSPPTPLDEEADFLALPEDELLLTLPREHRLANDKAIKLKELSQESMVQLKDAHCLSRQSQSICHLGGLNPKITIQSSQLETALGMVELGFGFTFTPRMALDSHRHRQVSYHSVSPRPVTRDIRLIWLRRHRLSKTQQALLALLRTYIEK